MPHRKRLKLDETENDLDTSNRLGDSTTKSLNIPQSKYSKLLRRDCKHNNYLRASYTLRKQSEDFLKVPPTFDDFTVTPDRFWFDLPYAIVKPFISEEEIDFCRQLLTEKAVYREKLKSCAQMYQKEKKWLNLQYINRSKYVKLPKYLVDLTVGNICDPDKQFKGIYNWYYSGGTLTKFNDSNEEYLCCPLPDNNLRLVNLNSHYNDCHIIEMNNSNTKPIFNLYIENASCGTPIIVTRQRNSLNCYQLVGNDSFSLLNIFKAASKGTNPFLDIKIDNNEVAYLNYNRKLTITKLDSFTNENKTLLFEAPENKLSDGYCQLEYLDQNSLGFIDRNTLRFLDLRSFNEESLDMTDKLFLCDDLCYLTHLKASPYIFLATIHSIKKLDLRMKKIVKTWQHMLSGQPSMMKIEKSFQGNLIFLSSEKYNERAILLSNDSESNIVQLVPNNFETFIKCNMSNFDPNSYLYENRLKFSTSGIEMTRTKNQFSLYTCNNLGDIFKTNLNNSQEDNTLSLSKFISWRVSFKKRPNPCVVTHLKDLSNAKFILEKPIRENALDRYIKPNTKRLDFIAENTIEGSAFAHIWISDEKATKESLAPTISATNKVSDWLEGVHTDVTEEE